MPRRLTVATPPPGLFEVLDCVAVTCGRSFSTFSTFAEPACSWNSCELTMAIGLVLSRSGRAMREPVTTISASGCGPASVTACAVACAASGEALGGTACARAGLA